MKVSSRSIYNDRRTLAEKIEDFFESKYLKFKSIFIRFINFFLAIKYYLSSLVLKWKLYRTWNKTAKTSRCTGQSSYNMELFNTIFEKELLNKVKDGVSKNVIWQKPLLLLTNNDKDYLYICDTLNELYRVMNINTDYINFEFVRRDNKVELMYKGKDPEYKGMICDGHKPDVDIYEYLGGALAYDEEIHRYCVGLTEYEAKPVISLMCVADKISSVENIPEWMKESFEIAMLKLDFSGFGNKQ